MSIFMTILSMIAFAIVVFVAYSVLKTYVLCKIKVNKWIIFGVAIVTFVVPIVAWSTMPIYVEKYVMPGTVAFLLLWFMDLSGFIKKRNVSKTNYSGIASKKDKKNDIVMRPKVKPNRIKNNINNKK